MDCSFMDCSFGKEEAPHHHPVFQLSNLTPAELDPELVASIRLLGGRFLLKQGLDESCTHLVLGRFTKTEKVLLALARGIWMVGTDFLEESARSKRWADEDEFDVGSPVQRNTTTTTTTRVAPHEVRRERADKGGEFHGMTALVLLNEEHKRKIYERILERGGARTVAWTWSDLPVVVESQSEQLRIFADPEVLLHPMLSNVNRTFYSYLFISDSLIKSPAKSIEHFNLEIDYIRDMHRLYKSTEIAKTVASLERNCSLVLGPDWNDSFNRKRQAEIPDSPMEQGSKRQFTFSSHGSSCSPGASNLFFSSPMKSITRKKTHLSSFSSSSSFRSSNSDVSDSAATTDMPVRQTNETELVQLLSEKGSHRRISCYGSDVVDGVPRMLYPEIAELAAQETFFNDVLETYVDNSYDEEEDRTAMWLWAVSFLEDSSSSHLYYPTISTFRRLLQSGILRQSNSVVRHRVAAFLTSLVAVLHPPVNETMYGFYKMAFSTNSTKIISCPDPFEPWNFFLAMVQLCESDSKVCKDGGLIVFDIYTKMLEVNFHHWFNESMKMATGYDKLPLLGQMLWPQSEAVGCNARVKSLIALFVKYLPQVPSNFDKNLRLIMAMAAQVLGTIDKVKRSNVLQEELASAIAESCRDQDTAPSRQFFAKLSMLKPDWLCLQLTLHLMNRRGAGDIRNDQMMSLRRIMRQVTSAPNVDEEQEASPVLTVPTNCPQLAAVDIVKKNQFGETALHLACKKGHLTKLDEILAAPDLDVNVKDNNGWTAVHEACINGHVKCLERLLWYSSPNGQRVDVLACGGEEQVTALHEAVEANCLEAVDVMLTVVRKRGNVFPSVKFLLNFRSKSGRTATDVARSQEMTRILSSHLADEQVSDIVPRISIDQVSRFGLCIILRKYCSEFSLHYVRENVKLVKGNRRRFSRQRHLVEGNQELVKYSYVRGESTCATDLRTFNDICNFPDVEFVNAIVKILSLR